MSDRRIDLTVMDGELLDVHQHEDEDREGDGPFRTLLPEPAGMGRWIVPADGYDLVLTVVPKPRQVLPGQARRSSGHQSGGHR